MRFPRLFSRPAPAPEWCSFFRPRDFETFLSLVTGFFAQKQIPITLIEENGVVQVVGKDERFGLFNLAKACRQLPPAEWKAQVERHFNNVLASMEDARLPDANFDDIKELLVARLFDGSSSYAQQTDKVVYREDIPGVLTSLSLELPTAFRSVAPDTMAGWGKSEAELFAYAIDNARRRSQPRIENVPLEAGVVVRVLLGESFLVSSQALCLESYPGCLGTYGALVAVPDRESVICFPVEDSAVVAAFAPIALLAQRLYAEGPGGVSPQVYWLYQGRFEIIKVTERESAVVVEPPDSLVALLNQLAES